MQPQDLTDGGSTSFATATGLRASISELSVHAVIALRSPKPTACSMRQWTVRSIGVRVSSSLV